MLAYRKNTPVYLFESLAFWPPISKINHSKNYFFFSFQLTKHVFDFKNTRKLFFLYIPKNKFLKIENKNYYQI